MTPMPDHAAQRNMATSVTETEIGSQTNKVVQSRLIWVGAWRGMELMCSSLFNQLAKSGLVAAGHEVLAKCESMPVEDS